MAFSERRLQTRCNQEFEDTHWARWLADLVACSELRLQTRCNQEFEDIHLIMGASKNTIESIIDAQDAQIKILNGLHFMIGFARKGPLDIDYTERELQTWCNQEFEDTH